MKILLKLINCETHNYFSVEWNHIQKVRCWIVTCVSCCEVGWRVRCDWIKWMCMITMDSGLENYA